MQYTYHGLRGDFLGKIILSIITVLHKALWDFCHTLFCREDTRENFLDLVLGKNCT